MATHAPPPEKATEKLNHIIAELQSLVATILDQQNMTDSQLADMNVLRTAKQQVHGRKVRHKFVSPVVLCESSWNMLLELFIAARESRRVSVSSLCLCSLAPATTALRHIRLMVEAGDIVRIRDMDDGRRVYLELSVDMDSRIEACITAGAQ